MKFENTKFQEMKCEEATEFVSALCDGEMIPPAAAEHIGICEACRARLREYAEMGAELRRMASMQSVEGAPAPVWKKAQRTTLQLNWWTKGWETMRIPRFAFAMLLAAVVVLGSSLAIMRVRAHTKGPVLILTAKTASGHTVRCALSLIDLKAESCNSVQTVASGAELTEFRIISEQGDRIELGVRARLVTGSGPFSSNDTENLPETQYWFQAGDKLEVKEDGSEPITLTGELLDHMPTSLAVGGEEQLDPNANELRFVAPVLVRGKDVLYDFDGMTGTTNEKDHGIALYVPHDGRYLVSLSPLEGAAEGRIKESRVTFELNGQPYQFLTGAPVARGEQIWILHLPSDKPADKTDERGGFAMTDERGFAMAGVDLSPYLAKAPAKN
jgi:hypothetical protein